MWLSVFGVGIMAAGKVSVSRRGDISYLAKRGLERCADAYGVKLNQDGVLDYGSGRWSTEGDDRIGLPPPEKKRKFSPISWNEEEDRTLVSSESPVCRRSLLTQGTFLADEQEPGQLDEEDFSNAPNIFTSRWAYDDDDDVGQDDQKGKGRAIVEGEDAKGRTSSPESGITQKEESDGSWFKSSESNRGCVLQSYSGDEFSESDVDNDDCMEIDARDDEDSIGDELALDSDVSKARVPEHGRNMLQACRSVFEYEKLGKINEGSYGIVYKARDKKTGEMVALKKLKMGNEREGFPLYYLREINTHLSLNHPSIVAVREVVVDDSFDGFDGIYMVMDYVEHDLKALMQARKEPFSQSEVKCLMLQLLEGVNYLHDNWVLHRDLKTSNLLLNNKGELKICDFGMSRQYGTPMNPYTALVVTLWYRAPELLLGAKEYSTAVDMWSVGCIMAELLAGKPLFDGKTELEQLNKIFKTLGTPNDRIWPDCSQLPGIRATSIRQQYNLLHKKFPRTSFTGAPALSDLGLDLLSKLLTYDPAKRITAEEALNHRWFQEVPLPKSKDFMPTFPVDKVALAR